MNGPVHTIRVACTALAGALALTALAACGQNGPLYLPDEQLAKPDAVRKQPLKAEPAPAAPATPAPGN
jgi:predicted small lipoprotein YifL